MHGQGPMRRVAGQVEARPGRRLARELLRAPAHHARALPSPCVLLGRLHLMRAGLIRAPEQVQQVLIPRSVLLLLIARHAPICRVQTAREGLGGTAYMQEMDPFARSKRFMQIQYFISLSMLRV